MSGFRRKNRQLKVYLDLPEEVENDDDAAAHLASIIHAGMEAYDEEGYTEEEMGEVHKVVAGKDEVFIADMEG